MAITFAQIAPLVVQQLNAAGSYTATPSDPRFYTQGIKDAINEADAFVCGALAAILGNPWQVALTPTSSSVAHLGVVPAHIGRVVSVQVSGKGAAVWPKEEIEFDRSNNAGLTVSIPPRYWIDEDKILYHNGASSATAFYYTFTMSAADPPVLQAPDSFAEVVASKALAFLINVEGENTAAASFYDEHWKATFDRLIAAGPQQ